MVDKVNNNILLISFISGYKSSDYQSSRKNISLSNCEIPNEDEDYIYLTRSLIKRLIFKKKSITKHLNYFFDKENLYQKIGIKDIFNSITSELNDSKYTSTIFIISTYSLYKANEKQSFAILDANNEDLIAYSDIKKLWFERTNKNNHTLLLITDFSYSDNWISQNLKNRDYLLDSIYIQSSINEKENITCNYTELGSAFLYNFIEANTNKSPEIIENSIPQPSSLGNKAKILEYLDIVAIVDSYLDLAPEISIMNNKKDEVEQLGTDAMKISISDDKIIKPKKLNSNIINILEYTDTSKFDKNIPYDKEEYSRLKENCKVNNSNIEFSKYMFNLKLSSSENPYLSRSYSKNITKYKKICK